MSAGILALTNKSDVVAGTGTLFNTELVAGDFIVVTVGGITYTLPVKSTESDTSLTLVRPYPGPTQSGAAWYAVPRATQNQVTAELVAQSTEALRGLNYDKQNWQAVFSNNGNITVKLPDGSTFTGPSWAKIVDILNALDVTHLEALAAQIDLDAQQVAADKAAAALSASTASADAGIATTKAGEASASANTATTKAEEATTAATNAKADADRAQSANPDNQLKKASNLADVASLSISRNNLDVYSKGEADTLAKYLPCDDPTIVAAFDFLGTSAGYELQVNLNKDSAHIVGVIRKTFDSSNTGLFTIKTLPAGKTQARASHSVATLSTINATLQQAIAPSVTGAANTVVRVAWPNGGVSSNAAIINVIISFT